MWKQIPTYQDDITAKSAGDIEKFLPSKWQLYVLKYHIIQMIRNFVVLIKWESNISVLSYTTGRCPHKMPMRSATKKCQKMPQVFTVASQKPSFNAIWIQIPILDPVSKSWPSAGICTVRFNVQLHTLYVILKTISQVGWLNQQRHSTADEWSATSCHTL